MNFSGIIFLFVFLPISLLLYYIVPSKLKNVLLIILSTAFYLIAAYQFFLLLTVLAFLGFIIGLAVEKSAFPQLKKTLLIISVVVFVGCLCFFKYSEHLQKLFPNNDLISLGLPLGMSFYTFHLVSYISDVYSGRTKAEKNIMSFFLYVIFFPKITAGPIVRYNDFSKFISSRANSVEMISDGVARFVIGISKKSILAGSLMNAISNFSKVQSNVLSLWLGSIAFTLYIYYDFSGYSDMAVGLGKIFGFDLPENFDYPYSSKSISEFWRRWHMTLGSWFRDYVYIPLGGNRRNKARWMANILIVWFLTGLWHGSNLVFAFWGLYFGVLIILEKTLLNKIVRKIPGIIKTVTTMFFVNLGFVFFGSDDIFSAAEKVRGMFCVSEIPLINSETIFYLKNHIVLLIISILISLPIFKKTHLPQGVALVLKPLAIFVLIVLSTAFIADGSSAPFLYTDF